MGLYKLCDCAKPDRCSHEWHASFQRNNRRARVSLSKWANRDIDNRTLADEVFDQLKASVRTGKVTRHEPAAAKGAMTIRRLSETFIAKHYAAKGMALAKKAHYFVPALAAQFGDRDVTTLRIVDMEDLFEALRLPTTFGSGRFAHKGVRTRTAATLNRYLGFVGKMFSWAIEREVIDMRHPFCNAKGVRIIKKGHEDNERTRTFDRDEESQLLLAASPRMRQRIICAVDSGLRRGELTTLTIADLDAEPMWIRVQGANAKSGRTRYVPIETARLKKVIAAARIDAAGEVKPATALVFDDGAGEAWDDRYAWDTLLKRCGVDGARWHDWRATYATRLIDKGVALSKVRDLLGHHSTTVTERYDRLSRESLRQAARVLDEDVTEVSSGTGGAAATSETAAA